MENVRDLTEEEKDTPYLPEPNQGTLRIMDLEAGDIEIKWNRYNEDEVDAAQAAFKKAQKKGFVFYKGIGRNREGGIERGAILTDFDEKAEIIVGRPMVQGG